MEDAEFGPMAYREGNAAKIREALLDSAKRGGIQGRAEEALVTYIRHKFQSKTETAWIKKYDSIRGQSWMHGVPSAALKGYESAPSNGVVGGKVEG